MHICLITTELFTRRRFGGFGRAARRIGAELAHRGMRVSVVMPGWRGDQIESFLLDGMRVLEFPQKSLRRPAELLRACDADVYHSIDVSLPTAIARWVRPERGHVITIRDPRLLRDWRTEWQATHDRRRTRLLWPLLYIENPLVRRAVRATTHLYLSSPTYADRVVRKYHLRHRPRFLPTPIDIPGRVVKAEEPTVCFVGRWDGIKRPELFFELARSFPDVRFIAVGATADRRRDAALRQTASGIPNLEAPGSIDQFDSFGVADVLARSWILVNTSAYEAVPTTFVEAAAHRCAVLSIVEGGVYPSRFGHLAADGDLATGLRLLLADGRWRTAGENGYRYVSEMFDAAIDRHIEVYEQAASEQRAGTLTTGPIAGEHPFRVPR